jgi:hypothetical protein
MQPTQNKHRLSTSLLAKEERSMELGPNDGLINCQGRVMTNARRPPALGVR